MRKFAVALLATTVMAAPAAFAASNNYQEQPQGQQTQGQQTQQNDSQQSGMKQSGMKQGEQNAQNQNANDRQSKNQNQQSAQDQQSKQGKQQQTAENNQPISPQDLSRSEIRQVQQALQKDGFDSGRVDGRWGPETQSAVKQFQQSKQMQPTGKLDEKTVADLGLDASQFTQSQNQQ